MRREREVLAQFQQLWEATQAGQGCIQQQIPQLLRPAPQPGSIKALVQEQAITQQQQLQARQQLDDAALQELELMLEEAAVMGLGPGVDPGEPRINYDLFTQVASEAAARPGPAVSALFSAATFLKFERDAAGAISLPLLQQYLARRVANARLRLQLAAYDEAGTGMLDVQQLQRYLASAVASAPLLACVEPSFLPNYLQIASRKLLLFHGRHSRQQRRSPNTSSSSGGLVVRLGELVNSPVMAELQEMLLLGPGAEQERDLYNNWFSLQSAQRVLATFTSWDLDGSGTLSKQEFSAISQGAMTELFISRVFEEHVAPQRGAAWPPQRPQKQQQQQHPPSPSSSSPSKLGSLPSINARNGAGGSNSSAAGSPPPPYSSSYGAGGGGSSTGPPMSPSQLSSAAATAGTGGSSSIGPAAGASSPPQRSWPPPLPPNAAGPRDEMDLLAFADFVLAWDHRNHPAAVGYFFKIFDIQHKGYLTLADLYTFFREVHGLWVAMGEYADLDVYDVLDEVMDMVKPAVPGRITKADLASCKVAGTVFSILANVDQFYQYNYRESFMQQDAEDGA
ncbi:hypothetical protein OEZ85_002624 [Tetradesmus obliquus]|uniref:EF-hand domain-containing protein n=1 Tax=Tetradesmus obliquus TaxID=3088 RepID=A0ABY8U315_TETOB|nr:hypothetical protein OEZ85_002624 [Tetradesmus obliquus]